MIFFRATTVRSAIDLVKGVFGLNGVALPHDVAAIAATYGTDIRQAAMWVAILLFIALICPNTLQILAPYEPALGVKPKPTAPFFGGFQNSGLGSLAAMGGGGIGRRRGRHLFDRRPERVPILAILARRCGASRLREVVVEPKHRDFAGHDLGGPGDASETGRHGDLLSAPGAYRR